MKTGSGYINILAVQSPDVVLKEALLRLGDSLPPLTRLNAPSPEARLLALPEEVAEGSAEEQRKWLLYESGGEGGEGEGEEEEGEEEEEGGKKAPWLNPAEQQVEEESQERGKSEAARLKVKEWSAWRGMCPVALKEGRLAPGRLDCAVEYRGQVFLCSSPSAAKDFAFNPRPFLLVPPILPASARVVLAGLPFSPSPDLGVQLRDTYGLPLHSGCEILRREATTAETLKAGKLVGGDEEGVRAMMRALGLKIVEPPPPAVEEGEEETGEKAKGDEQEGKEGEKQEEQEGKDSKAEEEVVDDGKGWILEGLPLTADAWAAALRLGFRPDSVVLLVEGDGGEAEEGGEEEEEQDEEEGSGTRKEKEPKTWAEALRREGSTTSVFGTLEVEVPVEQSLAAWREEVPKIEELLKEAKIGVKKVPVFPRVTLEDIFNLSIQAVDPFAPRPEDPAEWENCPEEVRG